MKNCKRAFAAVFFCLFFVLTLTACHSSKSLTFQIDNGDKIEVTLDTTDGYILLQENGILTIQLDEKDILNGNFLSAERFDQMVVAVEASDGVTMLEKTPEDAPTYYLYQFEGEAGTETTFLFRIEGTNTGAIFGSLASKEEAQTAFSKLQFSKDE